MLMALAIGLHLGYGGLFGVILARIARPVTTRNGLALGLGLWALLQIIFMPFLGWGLFGTARPDSEEASDESEPHDNEDGR